MSITAIVQNNTIKLPIQVPDGTQVEVVLPSDTPGGEFESAGSFFDTVRDLVGSVEGPADWAAEHDHYAHGTPKRDSQSSPSSMPATKPMPRLCSSRTG